MLEYLYETDVYTLIGLMFGCGVIGLYIVTYLLHASLPYCKSEARLEGKTVLITGGSSGIGQATAINLAKRGARIIIASRNEARGHAAVKYISEESKNYKVSYQHIDLGNLDSVRVFAQKFIYNESRLDILINNAGISYDHRGKTKQGYCEIFTTNYLGHFLLTYLLLNLLKRSAPSRIVNVSSISHGFVPSPLNFTPSELEKHWGKMYPYLQGYDVSKLALVLHAKELAKQLAGGGVIINSVHPGLAWTNIWKSYLYNHGRVAYSFIMVALWPLLASCDRACQCVVHCAVSEDVTNVTGKYFKNSRVSREGVYGRDPVVAERLWEVSVFMTGALSSELPILPKDYKTKLPPDDGNDDSWDEDDKPPPTAQIATVEPSMLYQISRT